MMRVGVIGCGLIGGKRAEAARRGGHQVAIVADLIPERAQALAAAHRALAVTDWRKVVAADIDIVIVATLHQALAEIAGAAVAAGKHVLVEKPAGSTLAETQALQQASQKHQRLVKVGFNHRFHPGILKARRLVAEGAVGPLMFLRARYGHGGRKGYEKEWRCDPTLSGGGELVDQGSHLIDLSRALLGDLTLDYGAAVTCYWPIAVDDNCFLALRSGSGAMAWLHASWSEWKNTFSFEIYGKTGKLTIDGLGGSYGVERLTHHKMLEEMGPPETTIWEYPFPDTSWDIEFSEFVDAIGERRQPDGNIDDAVAMHALIDLVYARQPR